MPEFRRKNIRLPASEYIGRKWYFLTMVVEGREHRLLDPPRVVEHLDHLQECAQASHFQIPAYCFMPDHLHLLTNGIEENSDLLKFADDFKQDTGFDFKQQSGIRFWQKKFHDHILRSNERWESVACYIWMNPVRKGLCQRPQDWPFSGSFTVDWKKLFTLGIDTFVPPWKKAPE
jgi:putative transposase